MINATEARKLLEKSLSSDIEEMLSIIENKIKKSRFDQVSIPYPSAYIAKELTGKLQSLGYVVQRDNCSDQGDSWDNMLIRF